MLRTIYEITKLAKYHYQDIANMYLAFCGNLSLWSVITNWSSYGKTGHYEKEINLIEFYKVL